MWRTRSTIYSVKYWYRWIGSEGFHTSIIYGAAGLMYGRYRGLGATLRNYSPCETAMPLAYGSRHAPKSISQLQRSSRPSSGAEPS
jgi:hypothetical protein